MNSREKVEELTDEEILACVNRLLAEIRLVYKKVFGEDLPALFNLPDLVHGESKPPTSSPARELRSTD